MAFDQTNEEEETVNINRINGYVPEIIAPEDWHNIVLGVGERDEPVGLDLRDSPNTLVAGTTGTGKTIALQTIAVSALARGHEVILVDTMKGGVEFTWMNEWFTAIARNPIEASEVLVRVFAEITRRKEVLEREKSPHWTFLSAEVRQDEDIRPLTIMVDGFEDLSRPIDIALGLRRSSPSEEKRARENNASVNSAYYIGRLAREAEAFGVYLVIAVQQPHASNISPALLGNLTSRLLLVSPRHASSNAPSIPIMFPAAAAKAKAILNDLPAEIRGMVLMSSERESVSWFQLDFTHSGDVPVVLGQIGVPKPVQWTLAD